MIRINRWLVDTYEHLLRLSESTELAERCGIQRVNGYRYVSSESELFLSLALSGTVLLSNSSFCILSIFTLLMIDMSKLMPYTLTFAKRLTLFLMTDSFKSCVALVLLVLFGTFLKPIYPADGIVLLLMVSVLIFFLLLQGFLRGASWGHFSSLCTLMIYLWSLFPQDLTSMLMTLNCVLEFPLYQTVLLYKLIWIMSVSVSVWR